MFDPSRNPRIERVGERAFVAKTSILALQDNDITLRLGEYFYQLRAALDGIAYQCLVLETALDPPPNVDRIEFPIYTDPKRFEKCPLIRETQLPDTVRNWLESIQTYNIGKSPDDTINELGRRLKVLHDCARKDRHRRLHVAVGGLTSLKAKFETTPNLTISNIQVLPIDFMAGEVAFISFDVDVIGTGETSIRLLTEGAIEFGLMEFPDLVGQDVMNELEKIMLAAKHVLEVFDNGYPA